MAGPSAEKLDVRLQAVEATINEYKGATGLARNVCYMTIAALLAGAGAYAWQFFGTQSTVAVHTSQIAEAKAQREQAATQLKDALAEIKAQHEKTAARLEQMIGRLADRIDKRPIVGAVVRSGMLLKLAGGKMVLRDKDGKDHVITFAAGTKLFVGGKGVSTAGFKLVGPTPATVIINERGEAIVVEVERMGARPLPFKD